MYLKNIEIQGFKSFANKTLFEFHNGITCIVGPNGSGKSNVADAVRWVLGEQSAKQLRGSNMQDIIFSGTQLRRPQGFASVAITFDNEDRTLNVDYNEVTVTRRVYRSGESEYLLNGTNCRLRDLNELFFDTGIGKEGYSIIGQGQIDKILSSKPDDRRELFDEAAGIVKFKYRKATAKKRLESEQANMLRLNDIMEELEKQIGPLERQSKTAREYLRLREELKDAEISSFVLENRQIEDAIRNLEEKISITDRDYNDVKKDAENLKERYSEQQKMLETTESELETSREKQQQCKMQGQELLGYIRILKEQIHTQEIQKEHTISRLAVLKEEKQNLLRERQELDMRRQELNRQIYDAQSKSSQTARALDAFAEELEKLQSSVESDQSRVIALLNQKSSLSAESQKYQTMLEQYRIQKAQIDQKLITSKEEESKAREKLQFASNQNEDIKKKLEETQKLLEQKSKIYQDLSEKKQELERAYLDARREYQGYAAKADTLKGIAERYEGYGSSIRRVMEAKNKYPGIHGVLADLIHVNKKYELAIETALGGSIQNIVTDTEQTAKKLIAYLKQNRFGRATFLPLNAIKPKDVFWQKEVLREPGVIGAANTLVETESRFENLLSFLLGRVLVVDHIDNGLKVAAKYNRSFRIVTLEGDLLNVGGSMTGGAFKNGSSLLARGRELEEAEQKIDEQKKLLMALNQKQGETDAELELALAELQDVREDLQKFTLKETETRLSCSNAKNRVDEIIKERESSILESRLLEHSIADAKEKRQAVYDKIGELENEGDKRQTTAEQSRASIQTIMQKREQSAATMQKQELELATLSQEDGFLQENLRRVTENQQKNEQETETLQKELEVFAEQNSKKENEIEITQKQADESMSHEKEIAASIEQLIQKREKENEALRHFFSKQEELSERINALDKDLLRMNGQRERFEESLDAKTEYLWSEYEMRPSEARERFTEPQGGLAQAKKQSAELKLQIKALGSVNVNAIEEYKELMERWSFMKTQYDDLVVSRDSLVSVIEELDAGMRKQFTEKFAAIRVEFNRVFQELFGGGKGTVELVEGEDVLEAGISIISQPPGKKLQNMMQLSGGEKALTAIALLFAIQNLKPSPFCLLDEIEAALDDSNVGRFAGYLHKLTKHTQFIVITHRRGTMTAADRLYGITMQEKGVSALVSVNLIEQQLS